MKRLLALLLVGFVAPVVANNIPILTPVVFSAVGNRISAIHSGTFTNTTCVNGQIPGVKGCETTTISMSYSNGTPSASVTGYSGFPDLSLEAFGDASVTFYFAVAGSYNGTVPLTIAINGATTVTSSAAGNSNAGGSITVKSPANGQTAQATFCGEKNSSACGAPDNISGNLTINLVPNVFFGPNVATIQVQAGCAVVDGVCSALADPMISFAPGFDHTGLSILVSPNPPGTTAPEPGTLTLLGSAMMALLFAGRRKRRG